MHGIKINYASLIYRNTVEKEERAGRKRERDVVEEIEKLLFGTQQVASPPTRISSSHLLTFVPFRRRPQPNR